MLGLCFYQDQFLSDEDTMSSVKIFFTRRLWLAIKEGLTKSVANVVRIVFKTGFLGEG